MAWVPHGGGCPGAYGERVSLATDSGKHTRQGCWRSHFFRGARVPNTVWKEVKEKAKESLLAPEGHWVVVCPVSMCGHPVVGLWYWTMSLSASLGTGLQNEC